MSPAPSSETEFSRQLAIDAALCARLVAAGCAGPEWDAFAARIYKKATRVTYRWLEEGTLFTKCAKIGRPVDSSDISTWVSDDMRMLAHEVVQEHFMLFKAQLLDQRWDPNRGATLFTYFMNGVVYSFPNVFRRHQRSRKLWQNRVDLHGDAYEYDQPDLDDYYGAQVRYTELLFSLIRGIKPPQQRYAAWMYFVEGLSTKQIAEALESSEAAARSLVNRARTAMQETYIKLEKVEGGRP